MKKNPVQPNKAMSRGKEQVFAVRFNGSNNHELDCGERNAKMTPSRRMLTH